MKKFFVTDAALSDSISVLPVASLIAGFTHLSCRCEKVGAK